MQEGRRSAVIGKLSVVILIVGDSGLANEACAHLSVVFSTLQISTSRYNTSGDEMVGRKGERLGFLREVNDEGLPAMSVNLELLMVWRCGGIPSHSTHPWTFGPSVSVEARGSRTLFS